MILELDKRTTGGNYIPVKVQIKRLPPKLLLKHQCDLNTRNSRCTQGDGCPKYGARPCCPPKAPLFSHLKTRKFVYLVMVQIRTEDYIKMRPSMPENKKVYFTMGGIKAISGKLVNKIVNQFEGQKFKSSGCGGCQYSRTGKCRDFQPMLEGLGINVVELVRSAFNFDIQWFVKGSGKLPDIISAVGGIYTDEVIPKSKFKEVIENVCQ